MSKEEKEAERDDEDAPKAAPGDEDEDDDDAEEGEADEDASDEDEDDDDAEEDDGDDEERDASTKGVAKALGVDEDEEDASDGEQAAAAAAAPNRAARRREEAEKRRAKRTASRSKTSDGEDAEAEAVPAQAALPKDKNARAKELLKRRKEAAEAKTDIGLSASELVQDQVARAASSTGRWFKKNFKVLLTAAVLAVGGTVGAIYFLDYQAAQVGAATDDLVKGFAADAANVVKEDKRTDAEKAADPLPVFTSASAKADAVLVAYSKVVTDRPGTGAALIARLGQAGAYLDKGDPDQALAACDEILKSELAKADVDFRARTLETKGFAQELKKELDAAFSTFKELEGVDKAFEDLGKYHQARIHLAKGEPDKAKEILLAISKKLEVPQLEGPQQSALRDQVEEYLRALDPTHVAPKRSLGGPKATPSPLELENAQREIQRRMLEMQKQQEGEGDDDEHGPPPGTPGDGTH